MPKVSVIIPVYGVEKYIERCARSLFEQTLDDVEYIFVDDCSPDKSIEKLKHIIKEYRVQFVCEKKYVRIDKMPTNSGLPAVRRHGLQLCTGEYVVYCDSDDWVDAHMYEELYKEAKKENADVVVCDFCRTDTKCFNKKEQGCHSLDKKDFIINCLFQRDHWSLCNKLFKRKVYYKAVFPTGNMGEDMMLCVQLLNECNKIAYLPKTFYYYYVNPMSITKKVSIANCFQNYKALKCNTDFLVGYINNTLDIDKQIKSEAIDYLRLINLFLLLKIRHLPKYKKLWKEQFKMMPLSFFLNRRIAIYNKVIYICSLFPFFPLKRDRAYY